MLSEEKFKQREAPFTQIEEMYRKSDLDLDLTTTKLRDAQEKLTEVETKLNESQAKLKLTATGSDDLKSEVLLRVFIISCTILLTT